MPSSKHNLVISTLVTCHCNMSWLNDLSRYIREKSYGLAAIRVIDYNNATFGIIEPYGYYLINYNSAIYLLRSANISIKFYVANDTVATAVVQTGQLNINFIDALFTNPPSSATKIEKFILFRDNFPRKYSAIALINRCLDLQIFHI